VNRTRALALGGVLAVAAVAVLLVVNPFGGAPARGSSLDNGSPVTTQRVTRQNLTSQTQVSATLGYAAPSTIAVPSGTAPSNVQQAQQTTASAQSALRTAQATLASDEKALTQARTALAADRGKQAVDCNGVNAAQTAGATGEGVCAADAQAVATDAQAVTAAALKVASDRNAIASAQTSLAGAQQALAEADASAATYGQTSVYTLLPKVGNVIARGGTLYAIGGAPVLLLYGSGAPYRAFTPGMTAGSDVAELNANLRALGYGQVSGDAFTFETSAGIDALQRAHGLPVTGQLLLGSIAFEPSAVRVTAVTPTLGATVQPGAVLSVTSTRRVVTIALDASQQTSVKVGDPVAITLPDNSTTPGRVSYVGTVATTPASDQNSADSSPTIEVDVTPIHPGATGRLDQAPVDVSITTASVKDVLVVPVNALLALASGGYAVEEVASDGSHRLVGVNVGLFDDSLGLVQVSGSGLAAGQRVVVPAS
jgi:Putative peptidoglycan binding domain